VADQQTGPRGAASARSRPTRLRCQPQACKTKAKKTSPSQSIDYTQTLTDHRVLASVGSAGDAYDNALAESFVDSFKTELIRDRVRRTRSQLELAVVEYIDCVFERKAEGLGGLTSIVGKCGFESGCTCAQSSVCSPRTRTAGRYLAGAKPRSLDRSRAAGRQRRRQRFVCVLGCFRRASEPG